MKKREEREFHGLRKSAEYNTWCSMRQRCNNKNATSYRNYGARGITVCDRWNTSFMSFLADMGKKPSSEHTIDRINNDLGYSPENCRWALMDEQCNNRRSNRRVTINGETKTISQWARKSGLSSQVILNRVDKLGWGEQKLLTPLFKKKVCYMGQVGTLTQLSISIGFNYDTVRQRIEKLGWSLEKAIETPAKFAKGGASLETFSAFGETLTLKQWSAKTGIKYVTLLARIRAGKPFESAVSDSLHTRHSRK